MLKSETCTSRVIIEEMHRTPLPHIPILFVICALFLTANVFAQSKSSGEVVVTKCWSYPTGDESGEILASDGSRVFVGFAGAKIEALSFDGKKMWSSELGGDISSNFLASNGGLFLVTSTVSTDPAKGTGSVLRSLSKETGITNWNLKLEDSEKYFLFEFEGAMLIVSKSGAIQSIEAATGNVKWRRKIAEGFTAEPATTGGKLFVAADGKQIFTISMATGEIESLHKVPFGVTALAGAPTGELIVGDERGNLSSLPIASDKPNWKFKSGGEISGILTVGDHLLITSHDNFFYFLGGRNGGLAWKRRLSGRASQIAIVGETYVLVTSFEEHSAVFTSVSNGKIAGQIAFGDDEKLVYAPITSNGIIILLTNEAAYAYSSTGCSQNKESGSDVKPAAATLK